MTDNEIINALELCATLDSGNCKKCPCREICNENDGTLTKLTLDLINRQKAENAELKKFIEKDQGLILKLTNVPKNEYDNKIKSEAIKEFAEQLKRYSFVDNLSLDGKETVYIDDIDNLVKKMTKEK